MKAVRVSNETFLHYISLQQLLISGNTIHDWFNYVIAKNKPGSLQCTRCDSFRNVGSSVVDVLHKVSYGDLFFSEEIYLGDDTYHLVRHRSYHFICANTDNLPTQGIIDFNDLQDEIKIFPSFQLPCQQISGVRYLVIWDLFKIAYFQKVWNYITEYSLCFLKC